MSEYTDQQLDDAWEAMRLLFQDFYDTIIGRGWTLTPPELPKPKPKTVREELVDVLRFTPPSDWEGHADAILARFDLTRKGE